MGHQQVNLPDQLRWTRDFLLAFLKRPEAAERKPARPPVRPVDPVRRCKTACWFFKLTRCSEQRTDWCSALTCTCTYTATSIPKCLMVHLIMLWLWSVGFQQQHQKLQHWHEFSSKSRFAASKSAHRGDSLVAFPTLPFSECAHKHASRRLPGGFTAERPPEFIETSLWCPKRCTNLMHAFWKVAELRLSASYMFASAGSLEVYEKSPVFPWKHVAQRPGFAKLSSDGCFFYFSFFLHSCYFFKFICVAHHQQGISMCFIS